MLLRAALLSSQLAGLTTLPGPTVLGQCLHRTGPQYIGGDRVADISQSLRGHG